MSSSTRAAGSTASPYFSDYVGKRSVWFPYAYILSVPDQEIVAKLLQHGVVVEKLTEAVTLEVESFKVKEIKVSERPYQGHWLNQVKGDCVIEKREFPAGR